jgi:peptide/nickel transport system ATP-binding protein
MTGQDAPGRGGPLIEVRGLRVDYGLGPDAVHAVIDADLTLVGGAVLGLAGESGSGKSTLAYAMTRLLRAPGIITGGQVLLHGGAWSAGEENAAAAGEPTPLAGTVDLLAADERQLRELRWSRIAVVMQSAMHALNPVVTIGAQLTDVLQAHKLKMDRTDRRERAAFLLEMVGISADNLRRYPHQLSGGMRQRVMIAMALALEPAVVIMDEPTTALDVVTQREILTELAALQRDLSFAVLFITHDLSLLVELADSIAVMYAGRLLEQAAASDLYRAPRHPYTLGLLRSFPPLHGAREPLTGVPGSPPDLRTPPPGCPFHPRCGYAMDVCRTEMPAAFGLDGRSAACWLHDGAHEVPAELAVPEPATLFPKPATLSSEPAAVSPEPATLSSEPAAVSPEPGTLSPGAVAETGTRAGTAAGTETATRAGTAAGTETATRTETATGTGSGAGSATEAGAQPAAARLTAVMPPGTTAAAPGTTRTLR